MAATQLPDSDTAFGRMVRERLAGGRIVWLTTVGKDGTPQPNPVWFLHEDGEILVYSIASANRLVHVARRPRVSLNFDGDGQGGGVVVLTGDGRLVPDEPPPDENAAYLAKYENSMISVSGSVAEFAANYHVAMRIDITRVRGF